MIIQVLSELSERSKEEVATNIVFFMNSPKERPVFLKWLFNNRFNIETGEINRFEQKIFPLPFFLSQSLNPSMLKSFEKKENLCDWFFEWKWDGVRSQLISDQNGMDSIFSRIILWSRGEEFLTDSFPEITSCMESFLEPGIVLDGELLFWNFLTEEPMSFSWVQSRIQYSTKKKLDKCNNSIEPIFMAYDILKLDYEDIRDLPFVDRRRKLEDLLKNTIRELPRNIKISPILAMDSIKIARERLSEARSKKTEGLMIKRKLGKYSIGRVKGSSLGDCWKWKVEPYSADAVLIYAQRGHGKRSGLYSDYTLGVWNDERSPSELVPFAKAYSGLSQQELKLLSTKIKNTIEEKFGPVKKLKPEIVVEVSFEGIMLSKRHKSGIAVRFPRLKRIRFDKKPLEADKLSTLKKLI